MSYNIGFYIKVDGADEYWLIGRPEFDSPTYNLREMFVKCMDWNYDQNEYYNCEYIVMPSVILGLEELENKPYEYRKYNAPNGWGVVENAVATLRSMQNTLEEISERIPLEYVWMRWG